MELYFKLVLRHIPNYILRSFKLVTNILSEPNFHLHLESKTCPSSILESEPTLFSGIVNILAFSQSNVWIPWGTKTPTNNESFTVKPNQQHFSSINSLIFHSTIAKLLCILHQLQLNLQVVESFICTCVKKPSTEDWNNFQRAPQYRKGTIKICNGICRVKMEDIPQGGKACFIATYQNKH